ncbi:MAG: hypothetical protein HW389_3058 [Bacteroidetes bacterium]|nr:hypothetical protein [Bacteroidota bacterium]
MVVPIIDSSFENILNHHEFCAVPVRHKCDLRVSIIHGDGRGKSPSRSGKVHPLTHLGGHAKIQAWKGTVDLLLSPGSVVYFPKLTLRVPSGIIIFFGLTFDGFSRYSDETVQSPCRVWCRS